jgi:hypothetical protein
MTALVMPVAERNGQLDSGELRCPWQVFEWHTQLTEFQYNSWWITQLCLQFSGVAGMFTMQHHIDA